MEFNVEAVHHLIALLEPGQPDPTEAARLAEQIGSWPEMLAHLLLRRKALERYPELEAALRAPAERFRGGPLNRRPQPRAGAGDVRQQERSRAALEVALAAVIAAERDRAGTTGAASVALRADVLARPRSGFDLHHRMQPEPR